MAPNLRTIKTLFALSCNICTYERCEQNLTDPSWDKVNADIAHICGDKPGAPRHDPGMTPDERDHFDNLMLLCPNCHRRIDGLEPDQHPPDRLREMKTRHIDHCRGSDWATQGQLEMYALLALGESVGRRPRLIVRRDGNSIAIENVGDADAIGVGIETPDQIPPDHYVELVGMNPSGRVSPGMSWYAGTYVLSYQSQSSKPLRIHWFDEAGEEYDTTVDLAAI